MKSFDNASANVADIRKAMGGRIGEIISAVVGDDTLQKIFEQPEHNAAYIKANQEGTPSAFIALDLKIIDTDTKNALLVAQAAERMALNAERAQAVNSGTPAEESWFTGIHDEVFKFVGSERDPQQLQEAQANWQVSQIWLNASAMDAKPAEEKKGLGDNSYLYEGPNDDFSGGLLKAASKYYAAAADTLETKGFEDAAKRLRAVAEDIQPENAAEITSTPNDIARAFLSGEQSYRQDMYIALSSDHYTGGEGDNDNETLGKKLIELTEGQRNDDRGNDLKIGGSAPK